MRAIRENIEVLSERLYTWTLSIGSLNKTSLGVLFSAGLIIRIIGLFGLGSPDMEHFKAWAVLTQQYGLERMYSASDAELHANTPKNGSIIESFNSNRTKIQFVPLAGYSRTEYMVMYPPVSVYFLYLSGASYRWISPQMENSRLFNVFVNFPMFLVTIAIAWIVFAFLRKENPAIAVAGTLMFWLNPIILLDWPIQGYNNPIIVLLFLFSLISLYRKQYLLAVCLTALSVWTKPQGILLLPLLGIVCLRETKPKMWLPYLLAGIGVSFVVLSPFILRGYTVSALLGSTAAMRSLGEWSTEVLSARSWNAWWLIQMAVSRQFGNDYVVLSDFNFRFGLDPRTIGSMMMILVVIPSIVKTYTETPKQRTYIFLSFAAMAYAYTIVQVNVQFNQFFIFIPILTLLAPANKRIFTMTFVISVPWAVQLFLYGGLGEDLCCAPGLFAKLGLDSGFALMTLLASLINITLWLLFCWQYFTGWFFGRGDASVFGKRVDETTYERLFGS